jgi:hypothetical protein
VKVGLFNAGSDGAAVKPISAPASSFLSQAGRKIAVAHNSKNDTEYNSMVDSFNDLKRLFLINTTTHFKEQITHGSDFRY